jgi:Subtilase family/Peptidase inhibitor I9/FG-GAP-like repeat
MKRYQAMKALVFILGVSFLLAACRQNQLPTPTPEAEIVAPLYGMDNPERVPGSYIVVMKDGSQTQVGQSTSSLSALSTLEGLSLTAQYKMEGFQGFAGQITDEALERIRKDPNVAYVEADGIIQGDQALPLPWGIDRIDQHDLPLTTSFNPSKAGRGVNVYVIDSGIRRTHQEFGNRVATGVSFINDTRGTDDCHGHGTHVSGTIGGSTVGVAREVTIIPVRVLDCNNRGSASTFIKGINWVTTNVQHPAVANLSLGSDSASQALDDAVRASIAKKITYAVAAGNSNEDACNHSPARVSEAITVGATGDTDARASFSNWGNCVDIFAPGVGIRSALNTNDSGFQLMSGTSMATPHVTGTIASMLTPDQVYSPNFNALYTPKGNANRLSACSSAKVVTDAKSVANNLLHLCYDYVYRLGDVNGDNRQDIIRFGERDVAVALSTVTGLGPYQRWIEDFDYESGWRTYRHERELADVNGDGKADIVGFGEDGIHVALSTGSSFVYSGKWISGFAFNAGGWRIGSHVRRVADVNGDKKADIIGFGNAGVFVALSTGSRFASKSLWIADFTFNTTGWRESKHVREVADVNGDGRADIVGFGDNGVQVALSTGSSFVNSGMWSASFGFNTENWRVDKHVRRVADVNGDKKADIIGFGDFAVLVSFSTGTGFSTPAVWHTDFDVSSGWLNVSEFSPFTKVALAYDPAHPRFMADVSGNGKADIIAFGFPFAENNPGGPIKPFKDIAYAVATSTGFGNNNSKVFLSQE